MSFSFKTLINISALKARVACVAWRLKQLSASVQSGEAARNHLPGLPAFSIAAPITYFDNPMTGIFS